MSSQLPAAASPFTKRGTKKGGGCTPLPATLTPTPFLSPLLSLPPFGQGLELKHSSHRCRGGKLPTQRASCSYFSPLSRSPCNQSQLRGHPSP